MTHALWLIPTPCPSCGDHLVGVPAGQACAPCQVRADNAMIARIVARVLRTEDRP